MKLVKLSPQGLRTFREFLVDARNGAVLPVPTTLLSLPFTKQDILGSPDLDDLPPTVTRYQLARYLSDHFVGVDPLVVEGQSGMGDQGFWAALSLRYFDLLAPGYTAGKSKPLAVNCYIPETETQMAGVRFFRHRIAGAYRLFKLYGHFSEPFLLTSPGEQSSLYTIITDSAFYTESRCVIEAVYHLYFDGASRTLKKGYNAKDRPGTLPRLLAVADQLEMTYDLLGIDGWTLLDQLPLEFDAWRGAAVPTR